MPARESLGDVLEELQGWSSLRVPCCLILPIDLDIRLSLGAIYPKY